MTCTIHCIVPLYSIRMHSVSERNQPLLFKMNRSISSFNQFPTELLHTIFDHFYADEILHSFFNLNNRINNVIYAYCSYQSSFQSIKKADFDHVCQTIQPNQVISLKLSDDCNTPDQSIFFLSYFALEQFHRLQALHLFDIEFPVLQSILSKLSRFKQLRSLSIYCNEINEKYAQLKLHEHFLHGQYEFVLLKIPSEIVIQLNRLNLGFGIHFQETDQPTNLRY